MISAVMNITVSAVNDAPSGTDNTVVAVEDTDYIFNKTDFGFSDTLDGANNFTNLIIAGTPANGTLYLDNDGDGNIDGSETLS